MSEVLGSAGHLWSSGKHPGQRDDGRDDADAHDPQVTVEHLKVTGDIGLEVGDVGLGSAMSASVATCCWPGIAPAAALALASLRPSLRKAS